MGAKQSLAHESQSKEIFGQLRYPLLALAILGLLAGIWAGWVRIGWNWPVWQAQLIFAHGPLMVSAFLGSLIALERAVALGRRWMYAGPLLSGLGGLMLAFGGELAGMALIFAGGLVFMAIMAVILRRQTALYTLVMLAGVLAWQVGNLFWMLGWPIFRVVPWWISFLILTIASERLEMGRIIRLPRTAEIAFAICAGVVLTGDALSMVSYNYGLAAAGVGMIALSAWLLRFDIARRTIRKGGLPQFAAICLLAGYVWLGICGLFGAWGGLAGSLNYDAFLHSVLLGFVISMIFGHAPIIFPSVLRLPITFTPLFYLHLGLLHLSLILRIVGGLIASQELRLWGGLLNGIAILLFLASTAWVISRAWRASKS